jgi:hypothetical protein
VFQAAPIGRRTFLWTAGMSAGLLTLSRLRVVPSALATEPTGAAALRVLGPSDARILAAIADRMTDTGEASMPRFADTAALQTIDTALRQLPPDVTQQLSWALWLFEYAPPLLIGKLSTFTGFTPEWQDVYLTTWEQSRFQLRRVAFQALKNLSFLGYYAQDATWKGIHYQGPWVPGPRLRIDDDGWLVRSANLESGAAPATRSEAR